MAPVIRTRSLEVTPGTARGYRRGGIRRNVDALLPVTQKYEATARLEKQSIIVEKPGFFYYHNLVDNSIGEYNTFLFFETGKFSLRKLYADMRTNRFERTFNYDSRSLNKVRPVFKSSLDEVKEEPLYHEIIADINDILNPPDDRPANINTPVVLSENFIPIISGLADYNQVYPWENDRFAYTLDPDANPIRVNASHLGVEFTPDVTPQCIDNMIYAIIHDLNSRENLRCFTGFSYFMISHYNLKTKEFVISDDLNQELFDFVRATWNGNMNEIKFATEIFSMESPEEFKERLNQRFIDEGFENYNVHSVTPGCHSGEVHGYNWQSNRSSFKRTKDIGYWVEISYAGESIIGGPDSISRGWAFVRADEKISLVQSAWCQHVTRWSGYQTDQLYENWAIVDWISGPFYERFRDSLPKIKEAPMLWMGRSGASKVGIANRNQVLERLRANRIRRE